ncbi:hypothetical protein [Acetobacter sp.]|jgi:hypothetical protein|uniref:hypothetical protein n=1 Tax=Acetobacter sp. TaxID=440 RepID=UPI0025C1539E|nr:hypothetical protein [Acetobacter sp.]MCI1298964.1 hypothetical protein [Acetobacter sp.]
MHSLASRPILVHPHFESKTEIMSGIMQRALFLGFCGLILSGCSWFGGSSGHHLTQQQQWEALGYKDGLKSVKH